MKRTLLFLASLVLSLSSFPQVFDTDTLSMTGPTGSRINMVFLGDGYQQHELDKFITDARWLMDAVLDKPPYNSYRNYFNCFAIKVPSNVSGAAEDPSSLIDNYFGSTFNYAGIWRLVVPTRSSRISKVLADNFPEYDQIFMVVNDSRYGGSGGWVATATTHTDGPEICIHELGHSFAGLSDEYWAGQQYARENINMTQQSDPEKVRWSRWLNFNSTGIYPHSESPTWYRPHQNCEMRYLNRQFCPVCKEATVERILGLTNPIVSFSPEEPSLLLTTDTLFRVTLLPPDPNTLKITWSLNNDDPVRGTDSLRIIYGSLLPGDNLLVCSILDTTNLVRSSSHPIAHLHQIRWALTRQSSGLIAHPQVQSVKLSIYPNPSSDRVSLELSSDDGLQGRARLTVIDMAGRTVIGSQSIHLAGTRTVIPLGSVRDFPGPGTYLAIVEYDNQHFRLPFLIERH